MVAKPTRLAPDNLTPPSRTPWAGTRILERYKDGLGVTAADPRVGESWEISVEPSFPSRTEDGRLLSDVLAGDPEGWLGAAVAARFGGQTPLLVKLLDSAENLSVQVHPTDDDPALGPDESGKPESWLVLDAEPGAGLYLGFREGVQRADVEACLSAGGRLDELMNFVPVACGDAFVIAAGTPHAIGAGVTLVEPQFVTPGRRGVTYRYWDWNRRYDPQGRRDPEGSPRELHVDRSLAVTTWDGPRGEHFVASCRSVPMVLGAGSVERQQMVDWPWFHVECWAGDGTLRVPDAGTMWAVVSVEGEATLSTRAGAVELRRGQSAVIPASAGELTIDSRGAHLIATRSQVPTS